MERKREREKERVGEFKKERMRERRILRKIIFQAKQSNSTYLVFFDYLL